MVLDMVMQQKLQKKFNENLTLKEAALKLKLISEKDFDKIVDPKNDIIKYIRNYFYRQTNTLIASYLNDGLICSLKNNLELGRLLNTNLL